MWKMTAFYRSRVPAEKRVVNISLDETSVKYLAEHVQGNLHVGTHQKKQEARQVAARRVSLHEARKCVTFVASICDDTSMQPILPQVLIVSRKQVRQRDQAPIEELLPENVKVVVAKSAWNTKGIMGLIGDYLLAAIAPYTDSIQFILFLDTASCHLDPALVHKLRAGGVWLGFVPKGTTGILQCCDTHLFYRWKVALNKRIDRERGSVEGGNLSVVLWIRAMVHTIREVLQGVAWSQAFEQNGYTLHASSVSSKLLLKLGIDVFPAVMGECLTVEEFSKMMPRPLIDLHAALFNDSPVPMPMLALPEAPVAADQHTPRVRLRRKTSIDALLHPSGSASGAVSSSAPLPLHPLGVHPHGVAADLD